MTNYNLIEDYQAKKELKRKLEALGHMNVIITTLSMLSELRKTFKKSEIIGYVSTGGIDHFYHMETKETLFTIITLDSLTGEEY